MIELLYTTLVLFGFSFPFFLIFKYFKPLKIVLIFFQFIISVLLLPEIFYKKHSLYKDPSLSYIQDIDFFPIYSLSKLSDIDGNFKNISYGVMKNSRFSLIKTTKYSTKCLENYYIGNDQSCPITDIKLGKKGDNIYENFIEINRYEYIYYTNENKLGKLYKSFNYFDFKKNAQDVFSPDEIAQKEFNKISNPIYDFKSYIIFCDLFCLLLSLTSLSYCFFESLNVFNFDFTRIFNQCIQTIILIFHYIRFVKFIEVKNFFFDNENIYNTKDEVYFPNKVFNIDSFPLAVTINIFIFYFLYMRFAQKPSCYSCEESDCRDFDLDISNSKDYICIYLLTLLPLLITYLVLAVYDIYNDKQIFDIYDNIVYNWNMTPIKSIKIYNSYYKSYYNIDDYDFYWKGNYITIERFNDYNYLRNFSDKDGKICGKDNYGNDLYFPKWIDCPINDIYISSNNITLPGYTKTYLNKGEYLYYTNKAIDGKIIIDFKKDYNSTIPLNPDYTDYLTNIPFYDLIDYIYSDKRYFNLFSINYLGINISSVSWEKIEDFKENIKTYKNVSVAKIVLLCILSPFIFTLICFGFCRLVIDSNNSCRCFLNIFISFFIITYLINFILIIISLSIHLKYITNFMNEINLDFKREKNDFKWNLFVFIYNILILVIPITIECLNKYYKSSKYLDPAIFEEIIKEKNSEISRLENKIRYLEKNYNNNNINNNNLLTLNDNDTERKKLKEKSESNEIIIKQKQKIIDELKSLIESSKKQIDESDKKLIENSELINQKEKKIEILEKCIPFKIKEGEKLMCVIVISSIDTRIHCPFICTNKQIFKVLENSLYEKFPEYKNNDIDFISDEKIINKNETMEGNNLKDGAIIDMKIKEIKK